jgi:hypothetical protein
MAVVAVAIMVSFHLKRQPTAIELKVAAPLGLIFWLLSLACLISGLHNYVKTVNHYSTRQAIVQSGLGTQLVCSPTAPSLKREVLNSFAGIHRHSVSDCRCVHLVLVNRIREIKTYGWHRVRGLRNAGSQPAACNHFIWANIAIFMPDPRAPKSYHPRWCR